MLTENLLKALAWTFVQSLWQGLIAAVVVAIIISITKQSAARTRYNLLGAVLLLFIFSTLVTFFIQLGNSAVATEAGQVAAATTNANEIIISGANWKHRLVTWFDGNSNWALLTWSLFFLLYCIKLITGLVSVERLRNYQSRPVSREWNEKLHELQEKIGVRRMISVLESRLVKVPVAIGYLKPVILLPIGLITQLSPSQVETILLHELAHIRRRDYLVNILQHFFEAIYFFNPAFIWISSLLREEREACCDDLVVEVSGQRREYLDALVGFQEFALQSPAYAMGLGNRKEYLLKRVKRMLTKENYRLSIGEKVSLIIGIVLLSAFTLANKKDEIRKLVEPAEVLSPAIQTTATPVDTVPKKKTVEVQKSKPVKDVRKANTVTKEVDSVHRVERSIKEIEVIKKDMQVMKDQIGVYKMQYKMADSVKKIEIHKVIEAKRDELEEKRDELEVKRDELNENRKKNEIRKENQREEQERKKAQGKIIESEDEKPRTMDSRKSKPRTLDTRKGEITKPDNRKGESRTIKPRSFQPGKVEPRTIEATKYIPVSSIEYSHEWELDKQLDWKLESKLALKDPPVFKGELKYSKLDFKVVEAPSQKVAPGKPGYKPAPSKKVPPAISYQ
jgi:beta-lactamase regulating signal transducer with metallopeptidase domain